LQQTRARIRWQVQRIDGQLVRRRTKTAGSDAILPLPDVCLDALRSHRTLTNRRRLIAMTIMRHSQIAVTMNIDSQVTTESARAALADLGSRLAEGGQP
jgi:hypothetical protein